MLTFEKIFQAFVQYLAQDETVEIVMTRRGYTVLLWDRRQKNWYEAECCPTPEKLLDYLLGTYETYLEEKCCEGKRDLTAEEKAGILAAVDKLKVLCE